MLSLTRKLLESADLKALTSLFWLLWIFHNAMAAELRGHPKDNNDHDKIQVGKRYLTDVVKEPTYKPVAWAHSQYTALNKHNLNLNCTYLGSPICCEALETSSSASDNIVKDRGVGLGYGDLQSSHNNMLKQRLKMGISHDSSLHSNGAGNKGIFHHCKLHREYVSSAYELKQFAQAKELSDIDDERARRVKLVKYFTDPEEIAWSKIWLRGVHNHMQSEKVLPLSADEQYLFSKFVVTKTCHTHSTVDSGTTTEPKTMIVNTSWDEWIEPLTLHARHPFGYHKMWKRGDWYIDMPGVSEEELVHYINSDHILLQSPVSFYNNSVPNYGQRHGHLTKHILFDAGTSSFESSMYWFICAYSQRRMSFDKVYGWEVSLLEPDEFWEKVPPIWRPYYHFYNTPVSSNSTHGNSLIRFVQQLATEDDFVSLKIDIDTPPVEVAIALNILRDRDVAKLIDEFFFELHFRCEILQYYGWGLPPKEIQGLVLDRYHAMEFFRDFRKLGIRSHFWP